MNTIICFLQENKKKSPHLLVEKTSLQIAPDKAIFILKKVLIFFFLVSLGNHLLWYSLEAPQRFALSVWILL